MPEVWYTDDGAVIEGPFPLAELLARAADGRLRPTDRVSPDRVSWSPAGGVSALEFRTLTMGGWPDDEPPTGSSADPLHPTLTNPGPVPAVPGYEILTPLGAGGCAVVYLARQLALDRVVALKTIRVFDPRTDALTARLEREARLLARFQHPHIVSVFDSGRHGGVAYFAMERLEGEDLAARVARAGPLDEPTAWAVARQTAAALRHAAAHGIYHRDVKPANLFLAPRPTGFSAGADVPFVKVTDFGIARSVAGPGDPLTADGDLSGTPVYMAPEQVGDGPTDHRADIYGLGVTVYHALAGRPPFDGESVWAVLAKKGREPVPRLGPPVSAAAADLVAAMVATDPADRVPSYEELIRRIDALGVDPDATTRVPGFSGSRPVPLPPAPPPDPPPTRRGWLVAASAGVVLAAGGVWYGLIGPKPLPPYEPDGRAEVLFDGRTALGWVGQVAVVPDHEKTPVLRIDPSAARAFRPPDDFLVTLALNLDRATAAEVTVFTEVGPDEAAGRLVLRVTREGGAVLGTRAGADGKWVPVGGPVPFPDAAGGRRPYFEVKYTRTAGRWSVWFDNRLVGVVAGGRETRAEVRVRAEGGPVLLEPCQVEGLRPVAE